MNKTSSAIVRTILLGTSCLSVLGLGAAYADPTGGTVAVGSATITSKPGNTTINQTTNKALINWDSFSLAAGASVRFNQPGSSSITVNRVTGTQSSAIYGNIFANGNVWLINGNGILFGKGSQVNVGGLIATTSDISNGDFASGNFSFNNGTGASVINQGTIRTRDGGSAILSGASVQNQGLIQADTGTVVLGGASAFTVDFYGDNLLRYAITAPAATATNGQTGVSNSGTIKAAGGRVIMTARAAASVADAVVNNTGMISATSAKVQNGEVILDGGDGDVNVGGTIDATGNGNGQTGGSVAVTGRNITVADNARIDASGDAGGGTVKIGGDLHGGGTMPIAANVTVGNATIKADAGRRGKGGTLVVYSNGLTDFSGIFSAKGGALGGDGGMVETSGHTLRAAPTVKVDTTAPRGKTGTWLLDPDTIVIQSGEGSTTQIPPGGTLGVGADPGNTDFISPDTLIAALATTNVTLQAANEIDVNDAVIYNSANSLNLYAQGDLNFSASVQNSGSGAINLTAGWDGVSGPAQLGSAGTFGLNGGSVFMGGEGASGDVFVGSSGGTTAVYTAGLTLDAFAGATQLGFNGGGATGVIHVEATGDIDLNANSGFAQIGHGGSGTTGSDSGDINVAATGTITLQGGEGFGSYAQIGHGGENANDTPSASFSYAGNIDVTGSAVSLTGGGDGGSYAQIGHGGQNVGNDPTAAITEAESGNITVTSSAGDVALLAGGGNSYAQIGHGGAYGGIIFSDNTGVPPTHTMSGAITVHALGGSVSVIAGSDETAQSDYAQIGHGGVSTSGDEGGDILVTADNDITLTGGASQPDGLGLAYAQIGNGAGRNDTGLDTGNITLTALGDLNLNGSAGAADGTDYVQIGNGSFWNIGGGPQGPASGNITINIGGATAINTTKDGGDVWIGNISAGETGAVTFVTGTFDDSGDAQFDFTRFISQDIVGGDVTLGFTDPESNSVQLPGLGTYTSANTLTILSASSLDLTGSIQNAGTGAITLVGGWDGTTLDPAHLSDTGVYGNNNAIITVGATSDAPGDVFVGAASGTLNIYTDSLTLSADNGSSQVGYHGAGGGDINVIATGNIDAFGNSQNTNSLQLGNGSLAGDISGNVTGNITLDSDGQIAFFSQEGEAWLGNHAGPGAKSSGNVTSISVSGSYAADFIDGDLGTSADTGGNVFIGFRDNADAVGFRVGGFTYNSPHDFVFATGSSLDVTGSVRNDGTGNVTLVAGWDGTTVGTGAQIFAAGGYGLNGAVLNVGGDHNYSIGSGDNTFNFSNNQFENISVGSAGGLTSVLAGDINITPSEGFYAQLGYHGAGGGNIVVAATGDLTMTPLGTTEYAMIGNGSLANDVTGNITGNITVQVGGTTTIADSETGQSWVGNVAGGTFTETGNVLLTTFDLDGGQGFGANIAADLGGGDVTLGIGDSESLTTVEGVSAYSSAHTLNLLSAGSWAFGSSVQNSGTGAINVVAGWDGTTFDAAHFADAGVFGNGGGSVTIGGPDANRDIAVGSAGGTNIDTGSLTVDGVNGYAQLGYRGTGGAINVHATGNVSLTGTNAQIGDGTTLGSNAQAGAVIIYANFVLGQSGDAIVATDLLFNTAHDIGSSTAPVTIAANTLGISSGGAVFLSSPNGGVTFAGVVDTGTNGLTLAAAGPITQTVLLHTGALTLSTTSGAITLSNLANAVSGTVRLSTPGSATFYDTLATNVGATNIGGDFTLLSKGNVNLQAPVQMVSGNLTVVAGWDGTTTDPAAFGNAGVYGNGTGTGNIVVGGTGATGTVSVGAKVGTTNLYASNITLAAAAGYAQIGYHGTGGGAIHLVALHDLTLNGGTSSAMVGNGSGGTDVTGAVTGDIDIRVGGSVTLNSADANTRAWIGNRTGGTGGETGNVLILTAATGGNQNCDLACFAQSDIVGGDVTIGITSALDGEIDQAVAYNSAHTLTVLTVGSLAVVGAVQNAGTGAINLVAGWDGHTLSPSSFGTAGVFGIGGKGVTIGGAAATGNVAIGSAGGTTSIYGASLQVAAVHGYAQIGFNGHGNGAIFVRTTGDVTVTGGAAAGQFAQIGNGGLQTSGSNHGNIDIGAGGDLILTGGAGAEAYAQIGHGGAESNTGATGYDNVAVIAVSATNVTLNAGAGSAAYVQIGNGGYKSGLNLAGGQANNGGDITITAGHAVSLLGNGADAYAQIGNGGSQSNLNPSAAAGGSDSGNITVQAPNGANGSVTLASGAGANAYSQIGNGGYDINAGATATVANWTVTGDISVTDLSLTGNGVNAYSQIGNGDASRSGTGNVSGNITIDANGQVSYTNGTGPHAPATIGNFTGQGTVMGTLEGAQPPSDVSTDPVVLGNVAVNTANNGSPTNNVPVIVTVVITDTDQGKANGNTATTLPVPPPGPLASLDGAPDSSGPNTSDSATVVIADSLDGSTKPISSTTLMNGMLKQTMPGAGSGVHGVPPADQDFSSWGNEALWQ